MRNLKKLQKTLEGSTSSYLSELRIENNYTRHRLAAELFIDVDDIKYLETLSNESDVSLEAALYTMFFSTRGVVPEPIVTNENENVHPISYYIGTQLEREAERRRAANGAPFLS